MEKISQLEILALFIFLLFGCEAGGVAVSGNSSVIADNRADISNQTVLNQNINQEAVSVVNSDNFKTALYAVTKVVDGDTIDVNIGGTVERIRLIGINTPETVDPRKPVECFGVEASNKAKAVLTGQFVSLESDDTQANRDKYGRLLRYVFLQDGTNFNQMMIEQGYAYEYTYDLPYKYQSEFKQAQNYARENKLGLWQDNVCQTATTPTTTPTPTPNTNQNKIVNTNTNTVTTPAPAPVIIPTPAPVVTPDPEPAPAPVATNCVIKGNISSSGEKIYHVPGCSSYNATIITESKGERWFCTETEATAAGWRKALNCPR